MNTVATFLLNNGAYFFEEPIEKGFLVYFIIPDNFKDIIPKDLKNKLGKSFDAYTWELKNKNNKSQCRGSIFTKSAYLEREKHLKKEHKKEVNEDTKRHYGVYGLYSNNKLVYIDSTFRSFEERRKEHEECLKSNSKQLYIYNLINSIDLRPLIDCSELEVNKELTISDIESMELALITIYKPEGNLAGKTVQFQYNRKAF